MLQIARACRRPRKGHAPRSEDDKSSSPRRPVIDPRLWFAKRVDAAPASDERGRVGAGPHRDGTSGHEGYMSQEPVRGLRSITAPTLPFARSYELLAGGRRQARHGERHDRSHPEGGAAGADPSGAQHLAGLDT